MTLYTVHHIPTEGCQLGLPCIDIYTGTTPHTVTRVHLNILREVVHTSTRPPRACPVGRPSHPGLPRGQATATPPSAHRQEVYLTTIPTSSVVNLVLSSVLLHCCTNKPEVVNRMVFHLCRPCPFLILPTVPSTGISGL